MSVQGYRRKPLAIALIAAVFVVMPAVVLVQCFIRSGGSFEVLRQVIGSRYFLEEGLLSWSAAAAVFVVSRLSFLCFALLSGYALFTKGSHLVAHPNLETPATLLITGGWFAVVGYFFTSSLKAPYLNPQLRWWTRPLRIALRSSATITVQKATMPVTVLNLSAGGAFVKVDDALADAQGVPQRLGEPVDVAMELLRGDQPAATALRVAARAALVWKGKPGSPYRNGFGIKFTALSRDQRRQLRQYLRDEATRKPAAVV